MDDPEPLWNKRELAAFYKVSEKTIDDWISQEKVLVIRTPGGAPRFRRPAESRP